MTVKLEEIDLGIREIGARRNVYAFSPKPIPTKLLRKLFQAARLAPSSFNEQPWRFILALRQGSAADKFEDLTNALVESNQKWARHSAALILSVAKLASDRSGKANRHALHDVGLPTQNLILQATALGLNTHPMAGFYPDKVRELFSIPEGFDPVTVIAVGYPGDPSKLPDEIRARHDAVKNRKPLQEFVFSSDWENATFKWSEPEGNSEE